MNRSNIEKVLSFDPLYAAEQLTGKSYKEDKDTSMLGMVLAMDHADRKAKLLQSVGDSNWRMTTDEFIELAQRLGFVEILRERVEGTPDTFYLFWRKGILLRLESYSGGRSINRADLWLNYKGPRSVLFGCSNGLAKKDSDGNPIWDVSVDVREGFHTILERLESAGEILDTWVARPFIWLLTYVDTKTDYNYEQINEQRIAKLPEDVRKAITPEAAE
jgi:hypothetical protein